MFIRCVRRGWSKNGEPKKLLLNTDHIIAVEESEQGTAIVTCTGKDGEDEAIMFYLTETYEWFVSEILGRE